MQTDRADANVVCLDPGHQKTADFSLEPVAPESLTLKVACAPGTYGLLTKTPEHEVVLAVALATERELRNAGVHVVLTRRTDDVKLTNRQRATIANEAGAQLCVRIHCNGVRQTARWVAWWRGGLETLVPARGSVPERLYVTSASYASTIHNRLLEATHFRDRGLSERSDLTGFNWSQVPVVLTELGYLTNPREERCLINQSFQLRIASALARSIIEVLNGPNTSV